MTRTLGQDVGRRRLPGGEGHHLCNAQDLCTAHTRFSTSAAAGTRSPASFWRASKMLQSAHRTASLLVKAHEQYST
jgi:hypothetical protein